ncbi:Vesicle-associated membrane protein [Capsicum annuum]|uniref:Vesicle-associated membrane protein n=1 Tax=Capsicum annuum TaxID=4072 RepID=A0A2G2YSH7_CAPAN|nr:Vesicle-associated membrane protein [Capsicum annuum]PHT72718.1 Vesicle-associated membrane protein [Capsicum annuum]
MTIAVVIIVVATETAAIAVTITTVAATTWRIACFSSKREGKGGVGEGGRGIGGCVRGGSGGYRGRGGAYCVVAVESIGRKIPIAFLERTKEEFTKKYGGGKAATAVANSLNREFGPKLKEQMLYCVDHPEEISKLTKVKAQVSEVKGVMMENIEKVLDRGEKIELLVDKTDNLWSQVCNGMTIQCPVSKIFESCTVDG